MRDNGPVAIKIGVTTAGVTTYDITVSSSGVVYTDAISLCDLNDFALTYKATCAGTPNVKIELEQEIAAPTNPNASDTAYVVPETLNPIETSLTNKNTHHRQLTPVTIEFYRFKITDLSGYEVVLNMWLSVQRKWSA
jgi:hypothetical protein